MSDITTERAWLAEETRRHRAFMDIQHRVSELESQRVLRQLERQNRRVLGFIPGDVAAMWPWLLVAALGGLLGAMLMSALLHFLDATTACRGMGHTS